MNEFHMHHYNDSRVKKSTHNDILTKMSFKLLTVLFTLIVLSLFNMTELNG